MAWQHSLAWRESLRISVLTQSDHLTRYHSVDEVMKIQTVLSDWLIEGGPETGYASPFNLAFKTHKKYYEWLEEPGNEKRLLRFGHAMNGTRYWELAENIIHGMSLARRFPVGDKLSEAMNRAVNNIVMLIISRLSSFPLARAPKGLSGGRHWWRHWLRLCYPRRSVPAPPLRRRGQGAGRSHRPSGTFAPCP